MTSDILTIVNNNILHIQLNRIAKKNAITLAMYQAMADSMRAAESDSMIKVIVIEANGDDFTAGNDLLDFLDNPSLDENSAVYQFLHALISCQLPIIAAVKGVAIGIGSTLLLHCEQVFCEKNAQFSFPFINLGLVPEAASSLLLPKLAGYQKAADLLLTGRAFSAQEALAIGLVSQVVSSSHNAAVQYAHQLATKPRHILIDTKRLIKKTEESISARLNDELSRFTYHLGQPAAIEALTAFKQKRAADFSNF